jgi:hypothetical protein
MMDPIPIAVKAFSKVGRTYVGAGRSSELVTTRVMLPLYMKQGVGKMLV